MGKRKCHPNYRLVKNHRSYTVEEIAERFGKHKNTVRAWVKDGLPICDGKRPTLILGRDLAEFLKARRVSKKQPCRPVRSTAFDAAPRNPLWMITRIISPLRTRRGT
ncbi:MAG: hypothetical protein CXZ00_16020 [Acidobacteria bacterium]|nr:MAG: hypothetical protein CXZ00_16020 [Acidobacteriota bacterium]